MLLLEAPSVFDYDEVRHDILKIEGSEAVHDLHVWQLDENSAVASVHIVAKEQADYNLIRKKTKEAFHNHDVHSITVQIEEKTKDSKYAYCKQHCTKGCHAEWCCDTLREHLNKQKEKETQRMEV